VVFLGQQETFLNHVANQPVAVRIPLELPTATIGRRDGLPSVQVHRLVHDSQGLLWAVGPSGLAMYDGSRIKTFTTDDGLSSHGLRSIAMSQNGRLWIVSDVGLDFCDPDGSISRAFGAEVWTHGFIEQIAPDGADGVWLASAVSLHHWSQSTGLRTVRLPTSDKGLIHALTVDLYGCLWLAGHGGLWCCGANGLRNLNALEWFAPQHDPWRALGTIKRLLGTREGLLIAGTHGAMVIGVDGSTTVEFDGLLREPVSAMLVAQDGLWLGIGSQLRHYRLQDDRLQDDRLQDDRLQDDRLQGKTWCLKTIALESVRINDLCSDRFGNIWVATEDQAIIKVLGLRHGLVRPKLPDTGAVCAIRANPQCGANTYLVAGDHASYRAVLTPEVHAEGFEVERLKALDGKTVWDMIEDRHGRIWAATGTGLVVLDVNGQSNLAAAELQALDPLLAGPGRTVLERHDGIWFGGVRGLSRVQHQAGRFNSVAILSLNQESLGYVYTMLETADACLWLGTIGNGLWFETANGFARVVSEHLQAQGNTYSIHQRADGLKVVVQDDRIVLLEPNGSTRLLTTTEEAVAGWSARFVNDALWVGSTTGLQEYDLETGVVRRQVTAWCGLEGWEFTTSQSLCADAHGRLFCGLNSGLMLVSIPELDRLNAPPKARLGDLKWSNAQAKLVNNTLTVDYGNWTLEALLYTAWFLDETDVKFRHRLLGFTPDWSKPVSRPVLQYSSLPPGEYTLEIQAFSPLVGWGPVSRPGHLRVQAQPLRQLLTNTINALSMPLLRSRQLRAQKVKLEQGIRERTLELEHAQSELEVANKELHRLTRTDALTGIANRRYFDERLEQEWHRAERQDQALSLLMIDVDSFKAFNDAYGHPEGDQCLICVAGLIAQTIRGPSDLSARYGGEEFAVILPGINQAEALAVAERLRASITERALEHQRSPFGIVTVSIGVAERSTADDQMALISAADTALYAAKNAGRNRVQASLEITSSLL
jgi:diguanylate cyclase (GGDEF)-like protein